MPAICQSFRCFDEVAQRGSVRKAAVSLHLTAAAVNQQILNLEKMVGVPLFDRVPSGMQLSSAGDIMLAAVRRSQRDFDNALAQVEDLRQLRRGHVNLGVSHSSAENLIPQIIGSLMDSHPGLSYNVRSGNGETLLRWVANGEVDVAYCLRRPVPPPGVVEVRAWPQRLGVVTAPGHPLAAQATPLRLRDCLDYPLALMAQDMELSSVASHIEPRLASRGRPVVETNSVAMARTLVARGKAVGFLIPENVALEVANGTLAWRGLVDSGAHLHTCLYQRAGYSTTAVMSMFVAAMDLAIEDIHRHFDIAKTARIEINNLAV
ncbi:MULTISPECIES: LysR family transcriptional regulator [unclassified Janthinobacterium]|uniref:LysR family transcriptional regulator n=1 Tax=unclassified Janthinobacterium TaxID=2610881 RepID=UPI000368A194|nr:MULTISPECIES: LysR family transcriptional regulator [unclassified Janthinobacterium]MEC5161372.1 DNA-binding transcriptional LysR family regulator [Janthinobacterium sp. CG_S6]